VKFLISCEQGVVDEQKSFLSVFKLESDNLRSEFSLHFAT